MEQNKSTLEESQKASEEYYEALESICFDEDKTDNLGDQRVLEQVFLNSEFGRNSNESFLSKIGLGELGGVEGEKFSDEGKEACLGYLKGFVELVQYLYATGLDAVGLPDHLKHLWEIAYPVSQALMEKFKPSNQTQTKGANIIGILGSQGCGKTLITKLLKTIFEWRKKRTVTFSIDDYYLKYQERQGLQTEHPFLKFRGPPGTHDTTLLINALKRLKNGSINSKNTQTQESDSNENNSNDDQSVEIPVFDKSLFVGQGDRSGYKIIENYQTVDFVIFEGWFVGLESVPTTALKEELQTSELALFSNRNLEVWQDWGILDTLLVLKPLDFEYSVKWRQEAEVRMGGGMDQETIKKFVGYFMESLDPDCFYGHLFGKAERGERDVIAVLEFDEEHQLVSRKGIK